MMFDRFIVATDLSRATFALVTCLGGLKSFGARHCLLLQCIKARIYGDLEAKLDEFNQIDRGRLEQLETRLKEKGPVEVHVELSYGLPKQEIIRRSDRPDLSMIVMGTQGRGFFGEFFLGSVAAHVARRSSVPTLLVPPVR